VRITFLTPAAALVALAVVVPLAAYFRTERRAERVRSLLRLAAPGGSPRVTAAALGAVAVLVGIAAAQPVVEQVDERPERVDAQVFFALDTTRSMLASAGPGEPTRWDRAEAAARRIRSAVSDVPIGIASLTDNALPLLFPTTNAGSFEAVLRDSIGVDKPLSEQAENRQATDLGATRFFATGNFFRGARRKVLVVFTDAQTKPYDEGELIGDFSTSGVSTVLLRFWKDGERVHGPDGVEEAYLPDPAGATAAAERYAQQVRGQAFHEDDLDAAIEVVRSKLGTKAAVTQVRTVDIEPLGPYVLILALLPLSFLLIRRNLAY
jgi:von Willebrand factor type A domain